MGLTDRIRSGWNAFMNKDPTPRRYDVGTGYGFRPDRPRLTRGNEKTIITSVANRIAMDAAAISIKHVRLDNNDRFIGEIDSGLNYCLTQSANLDQTSRAFIQDLVLSMLDEGVVAAVPVDTSYDPMRDDSYQILTMRTGKIIEWRPYTVRVRLYNDRTGQTEEIELLKEKIAIIENPLFAVMNEPNSTLQRLKKKLNLLDVIDEQSGAGKLDMIIQLPYVIKTAARKEQAENRRKDIEMQLASSKYGIAYTDGTEKITQLNRSVDNTIQSQVEYLTSMLYSQLGLTTEIMNGTADEKAMNNYYNRTIEPILSAIVDEFKRKFLTKTAITQKQSICSFRSPFKLVPTTELAELADKFIRNEILTANEFRQIIGIPPSNDPGADELRNKNISLSPDQQRIDVNGNAINQIENPNAADIQALDDIDSQIDELEQMLEE